jgi:hypothetical protein
MTSSTDPGAEEGTPPGRIPDFFIVGHAKCGTTALYEMLRRHPQIFMPDLKEPLFFVRNLRARTGRGLPDTLAQYLALFAEAKPEQRAGEASPSYLRSLTAAQEIAQLQPQARIIAILREPASFVRSLHLQFVADQVESERDLRAAVAAEDIVRNGRRVLRYSDHVHYAEQLRRLHACFPPEQVLVLIYDDFRRDNEGTVRSVLRFLEVDDSVALEVLDANPTVNVRSVRLDRAVHALRSGAGPLARAVRAIVKALPGRAGSEAVWAIRRRVLYTRPDPVDEELMSELRRRFKPEVLAVSEYLNRDLVSEWGYDELD